MAPTKKPATKAPAKPTTPAKSKMTVWPAATAPAHNHDDHHHGESCCGHHHGPKPLSMCSLTACCPIAKVLFTRNFWASSVVAFFILFLTDWLLHTKFLMHDYAATITIWRAEGEIRHSLIFITQALSAMTYAAIVIGLGFATRWFGSFTSGVLAASPVAICAMSAYVMLPFASPYIPLVWAVATLVQGGLVGLAICAALHVSRAPNATDCCATHPTLH